MAVIFAEKRTGRQGNAYISAWVGDVVLNRRRLRMPYDYGISEIDNLANTAEKLALSIGVEGVALGYRSGPRSMTFVFEGDELIEVAFPAAEKEGD